MQTGAAGPLGGRYGWGMQTFAWDARFVTGLEPVDAQHHGLVDRINALGEVLAHHGEVPAAELEALFDDLAAYTRTHFTEEMGLQEQAGVDPRFLESHRGQHARFVEELAQRRKEAMRSPEAARALLAFLIRWLAAHILGTDQRAARQIRLIQEGASPVDAFAQQGSTAGASAHLLADAVDELLRVVSERNRELEELNATLEQRVADRTAELQATLDRLRRTQEQLVDAAKLASVGQLASGVAHEVNNPVAAVLSNVRSLREASRDLFGLLDAYQAAEPALDVAARRRLEQARQAADLEFLRQDLPSLVTESEQALQRVQAIVRELKEFSQIEGAAWQTLSPNRVVEVALDLVPPQHREGVRFESSLGDVPTLPLQGSHLNQAVLALLTNAAQAVRERGVPGKVFVRTWADATDVFIEVRDTGPGLSAEVRGHLFEPFFSTRPAGQGAGLGLSSAWGTVQRHGGALEVTSPPGEGATFRMRIPLDQRANVEAEAPLTPNPFNLRKVGR